MTRTSLRFLLVCVVAGPLLGGCQTVEALVAGTSVADSAPQQTADAEKALTVAHLAYQAIGVSLRNAATSGLLHGADAAKARTLYDQAGADLDAADAADALANAQGIAASAADAVALIAQISALIPKS